MLNLDTPLRIPTWAAFTVTQTDTFLLNTRTNLYYALDEVGARLWSLLTAKESLRKCCQILLQEYEVEPLVLEQDILALVEDLVKNGLVEVYTE